MTWPARSPRWTRTGLPVGGLVELMPRGRDIPVLGVLGEEPTLPMVWLGDVAGLSAVEVESRLEQLAGRWNALEVAVVGQALVDQRPVVWEEPWAGWLIGDSQELAALRLECVEQLRQVVPVPPQPEPWIPAVPAGSAAFPGSPGPTPPARVVFNRLRLRWGGLVREWRLLG